MGALIGFLRQHTAVAASVGFVLLNLVGLSYNFGLFAAMGVSYADFAQLDDFLIGAFKSPLVLLYTAVAIALSLVPTTGSGRLPGTRAGVWVSSVAAVFLAFIVPSVAGYLVGRGTGTTAPLLSGTSVRSQLDCQIFAGGRRTIRTYEGRILSSAGGMLLLDDDGTGLMVAESCVVAIRLAEDDGT